MGKAINAEGVDLQTVAAIFQGNNKCSILSTFSLEMVQTRMKFVWRLLVVVCGGAAMAEQILFDFDKNFDFSKIEARDVRVAESETANGIALRIASGHAQPWPGITLVAPAGRWDLSAFDYVELDVANVGNNAVTVYCRVDNPGADGQRHCVTGSETLEPGQRGVLRVKFERIQTAPSDIKLFGMRGYPFPQTGERGIDPRNVTQLLVFVANPSEPHLFEIDNIRAGGRYESPPQMAASEFFPFLDRFGQYKHKDWPGKVKSEADLVARREAEEKDLVAHPGPPDWNEYGGWEAGPTLQATGFFRVEKYQDKWWLVDPKGKLFFSHGIDCVNNSNPTPIEGREHWFEILPPRDREFRHLYSRQRSIHGHYAGRNPMSFDFVPYNLARKYGEKWEENAADITHRRLRSWGLNTIANWSDPRIYLQRRTPYVVAIHFGGKLLEGSEGYWGQFRDVFDPSFEQAARTAMAQQKNRSIADPWCIGYFLDNEISWGDEVSLALATLRSPASQTAKQIFLADLKAKYETIEALNEKWGTQHTSWEALGESRETPDARKARADLVAFYTKIADRYFKVCRAAVKEIAPNQLYLGCRFAWVNNRVAAVAAKYCDVVSYNIYQRSAAKFRFPNRADVPLIIGEFHFGALDRGMFHTGLVPVKDQNERARLYKDYVTGVLQHPQFVGCHWFQYRDQATTGRPLDEENYQIGFVDIADTPYPETIAAAREVGYRLYQIRLGKR